MKQLSQTPTWGDINETHQKIAPFIHRTPILTNQSINRLSGAKLFFKCENFQKIGAFKMRGAISAALRLSEEQKARGLATHSSGNHAQAVALSAQLLKVPAYIVMPENAPKIKIAAVRDYGAEITFCAPTLAARESTLEKVVERSGATFIHPYDHYDVIAGQATAAKELIEDTDELECIIAPIGGGGLMSGTALITKRLLPNAKIYGAEPTEVNDAYQSFHAKEMVLNKTINTIADGLRTNLSHKTFSIILNHLSDVLTVEEEEIVHAMRMIWERMKIIIEPSCSVPLAAIFKYPDLFVGKNVGIILTGGNVDLGKLPF